MKKKYTLSEAKQKRIKRKIVKLKVSSDMEPITIGEEHAPMSQRRFTHNGRECVIETHYKIKIDGEDFGGHLMVDQTGGVHHHGLPNYNFPSAVDLVKTILDASDAEPINDKLAYLYEEGGEGHGHS